MKKNILKLAMLLILFIPCCVYATDANTKSWSGTNPSECDSHQDAGLVTDKSAYFSHCMKATCKNNNPVISYSSSNKVTCSNGNTNPYYRVIDNNACEKYKAQLCNNGVVKYCSMIMYYDCERTPSGASFYTTTKTTTTKKRTTTKNNSSGTTTTTSTTTTQKVSSTKLSSIILSSGKIDFKSNFYEYEITVDDSVTTINVSAIPEDKSSKVDIEGNANITNGSVIKITVTGTDGSTSIYSIKVNKNDKKLSNNANLKSLTIDEYEISFSPSITNYSVIVSEDTKALGINYVTENNSASVTIDGNENIVNGSKVKLIVTAEDGKTTNTYTIDVKVKKKSKFIRILFIIILILSILAGAYYIYKKFVQSKSGEKYEYE